MRQEGKGACKSGMSRSKNTKEQARLCAFSQTLGLSPLTLADGMDGPFIKAIRNGILNLNSDYRPVYRWLEADIEQDKP